MLYDSYQWSGKEYVANSGLIVAHAFRGIGLAMRIKKRIFQLSRELFPEAKIFSITTGAAVMKMNYELGFRPVPFSLLTDAIMVRSPLMARTKVETVTSQDALPMVLLLAQI